MRTIRWQLLVGLLCGTGLAVLVAGSALYREVRHEANELADRELHQIAMSLPERFVAGEALPATEDAEDRIVVQVWDGAGAPVYGSSPELALPNYAVDGFRSLPVRGAGWRVYGERHDGRYVQVAQPLSVRELYAAGMAWRLCLPLLGLIGILAAVILVVVRRALAPLDALARAVARQSATQLAPLAVGRLSPELLPMVDALNALLRRIEEALASQRKFVADAAHELRSPLTALKLQLQLAEQTPDGAQRVVSFAKLHERVDRASHLVTQLLTLARQEAGQGAQARAAVDLHALAQAVVSDQATFAESRDIDLGVDAGAIPVATDGDADSLRILLSNLVDNALRYTQEGGLVDVSCGRAADGPFLRVSDNGPGVAPAERARLFDRFYRPDGNKVWGCGLGMSIVKNIADVHGASVDLADGTGGAGLVVTVHFSQAIQGR